MSAGGSITFDLWPKDDGHQADKKPVPWLDLDAEPQPIACVFSLDGKGMLARATLHTLQGEEKTGKSAAGLALIVAAFKGEFCGITPSSEAVTVLWIDTEQDKNTILNKAAAVRRMAGVDKTPERLRCVSLRGYGSPAELLDAVTAAVAEYPADYVFLDGIVDLCESFNDEEKSRATVYKLDALAAQNNAAILVLIHTNKTNGYARGHLGAILQQKSTEIYKVTREKGSDTATVEQEKSRFAPVPAFSFRFTDGFALEPVTAKTFTEAESYAALYRRFVPLFAGVETMRYKELVTAYEDYYQKSDRTAKAAIKFAVEARVLTKTVAGRAVQYALPFQDINTSEDDI